MKPSPLDVRYEILVVSLRHIGIWTHTSRKIHFLENKIS